MTSNRALNSASWRAKSTPSGAPTTAQASQQTDMPEQDFPRTSYGRPVTSLRIEIKPGMAKDTRVYVGNMPYMAQVSDVQELFATAGFNVINVDISLDRFTNRNPSYCFVDLDTAEAATSAIAKLSGTPFLGRPLKVCPCVQKREHSTTPVSTALESERWRNNPTTPAATPPLNRPHLLLRPQHEHRRLIVSGLPKPVNQHTSDREIRELFKGLSVEAVSKVKSPTHGHECTTRYAFVDFESAEEANRAIGLVDGVEAWGGRVRVRRARGVPG